MGSGLGWVAALLGWCRRLNLKRADDEIGYSFMNKKIIVEENGVRSRPAGRDGFTLIELPVVIAIIATKAQRRDLTPENC